MEARPGRGSRGPHPLPLTHWGQVRWPDQVRCQGIGRGRTSPKEVQSRKTEGAGPEDRESQREVLRCGLESSEAAGAVVRAEARDGGQGLGTWEGVRADLETDSMGGPVCGW